LRLWGGEKGDVFADHYSKAEFFDKIGEGEKAYNSKFRKEKIFYLEIKKTFVRKKDRGGSRKIAQGRCRIEIVG